MATLKYKLQFYSYWHCGSGLAAGADIDLLAIKDKDGLPYVPGKTVKGLVREQAEFLDQLHGSTYTQSINEYFGHFDGKDCCEKGTLFFTNVCLPENEQKWLVHNHNTSYLFNSVASTSIDDSGIAKIGSLRKMEVTIPCTLEGKVLSVPYDFARYLKNSFQMVKRIGQGRNRGLGRCRFYDFRIENDGQL